MSFTLHGGPTPESESVLARAEAHLNESRQVGFDRLVLAREWALAHVGDPEDVRRFERHYTRLGARGRPIAAYAAGELAAAWEMSSISTQRLMTDALDLHDRMPSVWRAVEDLALEAWVARKIADLTSDLCDEHAERVDAQIAGVLGTLPTARLLALAAARVTEADQEAADRKAAEAAKRRGVWLGRKNSEGIRALIAQGGEADMARVYGTVDHLAHLLREGCEDLAGETMDELRSRALTLLGTPLAALRLLVGTDEHAIPEVVAEAIRQAPPVRTRPRTVLYLHLTPDTLRRQGVARAEELGALTRDRLVTLLGHEHVTLKPVIDLPEYAGGIAADCYEVPAGISEALHLARPADAFPFAQSMSRTQDQDHTVPYDDTGPSDQTRLDNLGLLTRRHHRIKTFGRWSVSQHAGSFTWVTPHGRAYVTDASGTHRVDPRLMGLVAA